ncbi:MAG: branched-chain amino acid ABC transporter permease [Nitrospirales bacterium]|nr:branched-chain amino acid ABC transporter permease [Nitrospirales bacterium]
MEFFLQVFVSGLLTGLMYSLVAIGFVLIYKASGVFNFAQGSMVLAAALTFVSFHEMGLGFAVSIVLTLVVMVLLGILVERVALRHLVNASLITLFMATVGLASIVEGLAQFVWGGEVHGLDLGIPDDALAIMGSFTVSTFDLFAAGIAAVLVTGLALFFNKTRTGLYLRSIADSPVAALSVGVPMSRMLAVVWATAGIVALVAGMLWGARLGVQFTLSVVALKALPVFVLGGFTSITGAIIGGLLIGAVQNLGEIYIGSIIGWGLQNWIPYAFALLVLLIRPSGLFGEKTVVRV